ncbi:hypothetical protein VIC_000228 [Vibrio coralliilyticus ATCC BAA-450]|nr:hypothetical protein VIC_000228 [Vibrio coralliilyticus ATCC BAA-450]
MIPNCALTTNCSKALTKRDQFNTFISIGKEMYDRIDIVLLINMLAT